MLQKVPNDEYNSSWDNLMIIFPYFCIKTNTCIVTPHVKSHAKRVLKQDSYNERSQRSFL